MELYDLPPGWVWTKLGNTISMIRGVTYKKDDAQTNFTEGYLPILRATNIQDGHLVTDENLVYVPVRFVSPVQLLQIDDIVICMSSGSNHLVGKTARLDHPWKGSFGAFCAVARVNESINPKYCGYFMESPDYWNAVRSASSGVNINNLRSGDIEQISFPLPPLPEQERIVEAIEAQLSRIEAGVASVRNAQNALRRYKASVLNAACTGQLLPQDPTDEPAALLLERILAERRERWEAEQREKYAAQGKPLPKNWQDKYPAPAAPNTSDLPDLPEGWVWGSVEQLTDMMSGPAFKANEYVEKGVRLFQIANVGFGQTIWENLTYLPEDYIEKYPHLVLRPRDIVLALNRPILNGQIKVALLSTLDTPAILYQRVGRFLLYNEQIRDYFFVFLQSSLFKSIIEQGLQGVDQPFIVKGRLIRIAIPIPPLPEQTRIVAEVERRLSVVAALEQTIAATLQRAARLRQSVLRKAFRGELVAEVAEG